MAKYKETSMAAIFQNNSEKFSDRPCTAYKKDGAYVDISFNEMNVMVHDLANYLLSCGVRKGDRIALFSPNRYEWYLTDMAILSIGAVNVPIYSTNSAEEARYVLENSESKMCFVGTEDHLDKVLKVKNKLPKLGQVIIYDEYNKKKKDVVTLEKTLEIGNSYKNKKMFDKRLNEIKPDDLATIIYTSGTTGNPKGVMLTHNNFVSNVINVMESIPGVISENDVFLSFLPLSHSLERTAGYYIPVYIGSKIAYAQDVSTLMEDFVLVRPTMLISVPRIYEKIHTGILSKVADAPGIKKKIFSFATKTAIKNLPYVCKDVPRKGLFEKRFNLADKLVFSKLKDALGMDRLRYAISGGGPLSVSDAEFFIGMGIKILEGFGLTETTPITNFNRPWNINPGTVGQPIPKTNVKLSDEGEILIKGPQVMKGYYKNPKATKEVFTKDGFFKTGDIGVIDDDNVLKITGRIKDIIVTAGGKNISPQNIENNIKTSHYVEQVAVIGDRRKYLSALIIPNFEELQKWAKRNGIAFKENSDLIQNDEVIKLIEGEIAKYTRDFARVEQIRKFTLLEAEWTQETDELTPTQKVKRRVVESKYANEIEAMYPPE